MKAAYVEKPFSAGVRNIPMPEIRDNEVLIRVAYAGICGSDLHIYRGRHAYRIPPVMLGHELSGVIIKTGAAVTKYQIGDRVTVMPQVSCGKCIPCQKGHGNNCLHRIAPGTKAWQGAFSEYFPAPETTLVKIGDKLSLEWAALAEPLAVAVHTIRQIALENRRKILVQGTGTIGLFITAIAPIMEIEQIVTTDIFPYNLKLAEKYGAKKGIRLPDENVEEVIQKIYGEELATATIVGAGTPDTVRQAIACTAEHGDIILLAMMASKIPFVPYSMSQKEISMKGTHTYTMDDFKKSVEILSSGKIDFSPIITHRFPVEEIQTAMEIIDKKTQDSVKVLIQFSDELK